MLNMCRYPGCSARMQTKQGLELHESLCHGMVYNRTMQTMFAQVRAQSGRLDIDISSKEQISFIQDQIQINDMLAM